MLRPDPRIRILSLAVGATAVIAAVALAVGTPSELDPFGSLGRADAAPAAAAQGPPRAFGIEGVDLAEFGYSGPDLTATSVEQLSAPMPKLPTEQAAAARDRLTVAAPHVEGLHQAKNLLRKAAATQDHHLYAAKVAVADAEQARADAEARLADALAAVTPAPADAPGRPEDDGAVEGAALASDRHEDGDSPPDAAPQGGTAADMNATDAQTGTARGTGDPAGKGAAAKGAAGKGATAKGAAAKGAGAEGAGGNDAGGERPDKAADKTAGKGSTEDAGEPAPRKPQAALPDDPSVVAAVVDEVVEQLTSPADDAGTTEDPDRPAGDAPDEVSPAAPDPADVAVARRIERLAAQLADARTSAARQWQELEQRRERRRTLLAAAEAAEQQLTRFDAHVRWLGAVVDEARGRMLSAGAGLVEQARAGDVPIVEVRGFRVHAAVADSLRQLVDAAATVGIDLEGRAYRPVSHQIELRRQNCGPTDHDIYEKASGLCSPPTAKPGRSLHELGLAVDFMNGENSITSRRDPAFRWLAANAPAYGFHNLPAEPWHWSVTAQ